MKTRVLRFVESRFSLALVAVLYLVLGGVIWYFIGARPKSGIEALLTKLAPKVLWANFLLIAAGVVLCWRDISGAFRDLFAVVPPHLAPLSHTISRLGLLNRPGVWLLVIFMTGLILVSQVAPQTHRIYYDEDIYANMGQNIAFTNQTGMANYGTFEYGEYYVNWLLYNKDPSGWPFLISLIFQLFGTNEALAFYLNNLLFAGGVLVVFFITRLLAGGWFPGLAQPDLGEHHRGGELCRVFRRSCRSLHARLAPDAGDKTPLPARNGSAIGLLHAAGIVAGGAVGLCRRGDQPVFH